MRLPSTVLGVSEDMDGPAGWILYDDDCGVCRTWVPFWESTLRRRGFAIAPLQEAWVRERLADLEGDPLEDIRILLGSGEIVSGANAYRYAMRRIWWAWPVFAISVVPPFRGVFDAAYRWFARHRHEVSKACRLPGATGVR